MYSTSVTHLVQSFERTTASHNASDSIGTQSIAFSSHSSASSACKAAAEPSALFARAFEDLKAAARTAAKGPRHDTQEYFDSWVYWKKHPAVLSNASLHGQLLIEHLLVLANWKEQLAFDFKAALFEDLQTWLQVADNEESVADLREQLCTGFLCVYLQDDVQAARKFLCQLRGRLPQEMFLSLGSQLQVVAENESSQPGGSVFLARVQAIFARILDFFRVKLANIYEMLRKQPALFLAFCRRIVGLILLKLQ